MTEFSSDYPIRIEADYPQESSRLLACCGILFFCPTALLPLPHVFILFFVNLAAVIVVYLAYWVVLFTGNYPRGMYDFALGALRWQTRASAWLFGLVDFYPPF